jgi:hypothetical protein
VKQTKNPQRANDKGFASFCTLRPCTSRRGHGAEGDIEADTTFVGGKEKNKHADKRTPGSQGGANKAVVIGTIEREGELRTAHIEDGQDGSRFR